MIYYYHAVNNVLIVNHEEFFFCNQTEQKNIFLTGIDGIFYPQPDTI